MVAPTISSNASAGSRQKHGFFARWRDVLQAEWKALIASPAGKRFQQRHKRQCDAGRPAWKKFISPVIGIALVALGLILLPAPGPGIPIVLFGLALVAEQFLWAAMLLDRCEPPLRSLLSAFLEWWKRASIMPRAVAVSLAVLLLCTVAAGLFAYLN